MGTVIGGLLLPKFDTFDYGRSVNQGILGASQQVQGQTALLALQEEKQKQQSMQMVYEAIKHDPALAQQLMGGSVLGSLGPAGGSPGGMPGAGPPPGPITQSPLGGGPAQQIPAYPDADRYAGVPPGGGGPIPPDVMAQGMPTVTPPGGAPGPVLASLGPGQGQPQGPQNPLLEMARRDPRAAMMLQQQIQGQQDRQWKMQEQRLDWGVKTAEYVARMIGNVKDQAGLDEAREQIRQVHPQAAAQMPQFYSKEAIESLQQKGIAIADMAAWRLNMAKAREANVKADLLPKLLEQEEMGGATPAPGTATPTTAAPATGRPASASERTPQQQEIVRLIRAEAVRQGVDPELAVAVATQESSLNPDNPGDNGKSRGVFHLQEKAAIDAGIDPKMRDDPVTNIKGGVTYLKQKLVESKGNVEQALSRYNRGTPDYRGIGDPDYEYHVLRHYPGHPGGKGPKDPEGYQARLEKTFGRGAAGSTPTGAAAQAPPEDPRVPGLRAQIQQGQRQAKKYALLGYESMATQYNNDVNDLQKELERIEAPRREVEKQTALQPGVIAQQEAGAKVQLEAEMNKPIGTENAIKMDLPAETKWKDVPKGTRVLDRPGEGVINKFGDYAAAYEGLGRIMTMLEKPGAQSIIGTLLSEPDASFRRRAGEWISSVTPEERKFTASLVGEIATIRNTISGQAVTPQESQFLAPMLPSVSDPDIGTVRAKLEALQDWVANKHDNYRNQQDQMGFRTPKALARAEAPPAPKTSTAVDKARDIMKPR